MSFLHFLIVAMLCLAPFIEIIREAIFDRLWLAVVYLVVLVLACAALWTDGAKEGFGKGFCNSYDSVYVWHDKDGETVVCRDATGDTTAYQPELMLILGSFKDDPQVFDLAQEN